MNSRFLDHLVRPIYNRLLRPQLPRKLARCNGVAVRYPRLFDLSYPRPDYKAGLLDAINESVSPGDSVAVVGGGRGVSSVHAARAGADRVVAFEAAGEMCDIFRETVFLAGVDSVDLRHALVGPAVDVYGDASDAVSLGTADLPSSDVLVLDCEGAETGILDEPVTAETVIVETHPSKGATTDRVVELLDRAGYDTSTRQYEPGHGDEKRVVVGTERTTSLETNRSGGER